MCMCFGWCFRSVWETNRYDFIVFSLFSHLPLVHSSSCCRYIRSNEMNLYFGQFKFMFLPLFHPNLRMLDLYTWDRRNGKIQRKRKRKEIFSTDRNNKNACARVGNLNEHLLIWDFSAFLKLICFNSLFPFDCWFALLLLVEVFKLQIIDLQIWGMRHEM